MRAAAIQGHAARGPQWIVQVASLPPPRFDLCHLQKDGAVLSLSLRIP